MFWPERNRATQRLDQAVLPAACDHEVVYLVLQSLMIVCTERSILCPVSSAIDDMVQFVQNDRRKGGATSEAILQKQWRQGDVVRSRGVGSWKLRCRRIVIEPLNIEADRQALRLVLQNQCLDVVLFQQGSKLLKATPHDFFLRDSSHVFPSR